MVFWRKSSIRFDLWLFVCDGACCLGLIIVGCVAVVVIVVAVVRSSIVGEFRLARLNWDEEANSCWAFLLALSWLFNSSIVSLSCSSSWNTSRLVSLRLTFSFRLVVLEFLVLSSYTIVFINRKENVSPITDYSEFFYIF